MGDKITFLEMLLSMATWWLIFRAASRLWSKIKQAAGPVRQSNTPVMGYDWPPVDILDFPPEDGAGAGAAIEVETGADH